MKTIGVIPARYASTRFPGKPLADICGKPMIQHVWENTKNASEIDEIYIATDSEKIADVVRSFNANVVLTSEKCQTFTDRVIEVAEKIIADLYVVILGDEPLINVDDINLLIDTYKNNKSAFAVFLAEKIIFPHDAFNTTTIKYVLNDNDEIICMSRTAIPYPYSSVEYDLHKHVGAFTYTREALEFYKNTPKGRVEKIEGLDQFRFIENHKIIKTAITENFSMSVDTPKDLERVRKIIAQDKEK